MIKLVEVKKIYKMGTVDVTALNGVSLKIDQGEFIAIIGASGSGKSTMMNILGCLDIPTSGQSIIDDQNVEEMSGDQLAEIRNNKIGFVFQTFNLLSRQTALSNVLLPLMYSNEKNRKSKSQAALEKVGLGDRIHHKPTQLSGGQQQRVAIARALVNKPRLLLLDEPTAGVDIETRRMMWNFLRELNQQGTTIILTTHYLEEAEQLCDHVAIIDEGEIIENDSMLNVLGKLKKEVFVLNVDRPINFAPKIPSYETSLRSPREIEVSVSQSQGVNDIFTELKKLDIKVISMRNKTSRLEELFIELTNNRIKEEQ